MFGISGWEIVGLAIVALLVFGPDRLPRVAADAGRFLRQVRTMIAAARRDINESLGPEFKDLDVSDLNPRNFVRKHLLEPADIDLEDIDGSKPTKPNGHRSRGTRRSRTSPKPTPYDTDAT